MVSSVSSGWIGAGGGGSSGSGSDSGGAVGAGVVSIVSSGYPYGSVSVGVG